MIDTLNERKALGQRLQAFRLKNGITAYAVAKKADINITQVKNLEDARTNMTISALIAYLEACGLEMVIRERQIHPDVIANDAEI